MTGVQTCALPISQDESARLRSAVVERHVTVVSLFLGSELLGVGLPNVIMNDRELAQLTFAMRIFDHDVDISYSTREPAQIRDNMARLGVTTMSAESKTEPGGYYTYPQALEQFHVSDERTAMEVENALKSLGREPVWKDWDVSFDKFTPMQ